MIIKWFLSHQWKEMKRVFHLAKKPRAEHCAWIFNPTDVVLSTPSWVIY